MAARARTAAIFSRQRHADGVDFDNSDIKFIGTADIDIEAIAARQTRSDHHRADPQHAGGTAGEDCPDGEYRPSRRRCTGDLPQAGAAHRYAGAAENLERRYQEQIKALKATIDTRKITVSVIQANRGKINTMYSYHSLGRVLRDAGLPSAAD